MDKTKLIPLLIIVISIIFVIFYTYCFSGTKNVVIVFHAGSLTKPLLDLSNEFMKEYSDYEIRLEASGSVMAIRKIIEFGKCCHILAISDYELIPKYMFNSDYADFVIIFAKNSMTIAYTNKSKYSNTINWNNWDLILAKKDVKFGFSNPNLDPCGYRALTTIVLHELRVNRHILSKLIENCSNIKFIWLNNNVKVIVPKNFEIKSYCLGKIIIRSKSVELISLLESGVLDYAFEYKSVVNQHKLNYLNLPEFEDLSSFDLENYYSKVQVVINYGSKFERIITSSPILYGLTIPKCAYSEINKIIPFLKYLLFEKGFEIFEKNYQEYLSTFIVINKSNLPKEIESLFKNKVIYVSSYG